MSVTESLNTLNQSVLNCYDSIQEFIQSKPDANDLCVQLVALSDIETNMKLLKEDLVRSITAILNNGEQVNVNGRTIEKKTGSPRKTWDHEGLKRVVLDRITSLSMDETTGEILLSPAQAVDKLLEYAHVDYWRVTELQKLDINADIYCEVGEPKTTIQVGKVK